MLKVSNVKVYDLKESIIACRNSMRVLPPEYTEEEFEKSLERAKKLAKAPSNSGEANFLTGIRVSFDLVYPNYISPELQRYHFFDIVTSSSKMHKLTVMAGNRESYNKYVERDAILLMKLLVSEYNEALRVGTKEEQYHQFMKLVSNCPQGIELFMRCSTNYMQLRNIYHQRKHHKLAEDWGAFCDMIRSLPYSKELITNEE